MRSASLADAESESRAHRTANEMTKVLRAFRLADERFQVRLHLELKSSGRAPGRHSRVFKVAHWNARAKYRRRAVDATSDPALWAAQTKLKPTSGAARSPSSRHTKLGARPRLGRWARRRARLTKLSPTPTEPTNYAVCSREARSKPLDLRGLPILGRRLSEQVVVHPTTFSKSRHCGRV